MSNVKEIVELLLQENRWWESFNPRRAGRNIDKCMISLSKAIPIIQYIKDYEGDNQDVWFDELQAMADRWIKEWM